MIALMQLNFIFDIQPFANWYFPIIWLGYILVIDSLVYKLRKKSLLSNNPGQLLGMFIISALFWYVFEFANFSLHNWSYQGLEGLGQTGTLFSKDLFGTLSFSTVLPALFETVELLKSIHLFNKNKLRMKHKISKSTLHVMMASGVGCFFISMILPKIAFPLIWLSFFLILDPINYLHKQPSIIRHFKEGKIAMPLVLMVAGIIMGILWEFWNYWAIPKWTYHIPYVGFLKVFEMPILGYLGYPLFALELYAMYWFVRSLFLHKEHLLE